jgi:hypothetical protein
MAMSTSPLSVENALAHAKAMLAASEVGNYSLTNGAFYLIRDLVRVIEQEAAPPSTATEAADRMAFADEIVDPLICRTPAYGVPGHAHCAACCYGTGLIITCAEDEAIADAAKALQHAAALLRAQR